MKVFGICARRIFCMTARGREKIQDGRNKPQGQRLTLKSPKTEG